MLSVLEGPRGQVELPTHTTEKKTRTATATDIFLRLTIYLLKPALSQERHPISRDL